MRRTLFLIPHEIAGIPVFGVGWLLAALLLYIVVRLAWVGCRRTPEGGVGADLGAGVSSVGSVIRSEAAVWGFLGLLITLVLPRLELDNVAGAAVGLPVRGYGMFLMLAAIASISLAAWRAERGGLGAETILRLVPWTFGGGFLGARLFYVLQYHQDFVRPTWGETLAAVLAVTQGGLVVYGGFLGGFLATAWIIRRYRLPLWKLGDVIVPCIFVGLFFGRLGCLMNGCCYGGTCEPNFFSAEFPPNSSVYVDQMVSGELIGITTEPVSEDQTPEGKKSRHTTQWRVQSVDRGSLAEEAGIESGQTVTLVLDPGFEELVSPEVPAEDALPGLAVIRQGDLVARFSPERLPPRAEPVWATQVISSLVAAVMFLILLILEQMLGRRGLQVDGVLMLSGFIAYAVLRIILEWVRVDEAGQFGTVLSISQWVSLGVILASGMALIARFRSQPRSVH